MNIEQWADELARQQAEPPDPRRSEMARVATAAREVIERLVATRAPLDALEAAAERLEEAAAGLAAHPQGRLYEGFAESANAGSPTAFFDHSPVIGAANPLAPPVRLEIHGSKVVGHVRFGSAYEGPPDSVHGGYVAAAFDEVLGMCQALSGTPGMTGTLTIRYRRPTPLHADLRFEATLDGVRGRKLLCSGRLYDGDSVTAEAEGLFIAVDFAKIAEMMARRNRSG